MSMGTYATYDYGLVLNDIVDKDLLEELAENDVVEYQSSFTGEAFPLKDNGCEAWEAGEHYYDETVYYISVSRYPQLFRTAYKDMNELVSDLTRQYRRARQQDGRLPDLTVKQVRANLRLVMGTYYG